MCVCASTINCILVATWHALRFADSAKSWVDSAVNGNRIVVQVQKMLPRHLFLWMEIQRWWKKRRDNDDHGHIVSYFAMPSRIPMYWLYCCIVQAFVQRIKKELGSVWLGVNGGGQRKATNERHTPETSLKANISWNLLGSLLASLFSQGINWSFGLVWTSGILYEKELFSTGWPVYQRVRWNTPNSGGIDAGPLAIEPVFGRLEQLHRPVSFAEVSNYSRASGQK